MSLSLNSEPAPVQSRVSFVLDGTHSLECLYKDECDPRRARMTESWVCNCRDTEVEEIAEELQGDTEKNSA